MLFNRQWDKGKLEKAKGAAWFRATQLTVSAELGPKHLLPPVFVIHSRVVNPFDVK